MVTIEITKRGVFNDKGERVPVGTRLTLSSEPRGWVNKYRVVSTDEGKTLEVATPKPEAHPDNVKPWVKGKGYDEDYPHHTQVEYKDIRGQYQELFGKKPHHMMKLETIQAKIDEALSDGGSNNDQ